jgi:hypothetical protein
VVIDTPSPKSSPDAAREKASRAAFDATYAEKRGSPICTPRDETFTMCPSRRSRIPGRKWSVSLSAPK